MRTPAARRYLLKPPKMKVLARHFGARPFRLLDIGAGNHSASMAKCFFPGCTYVGLDRVRDYNNDPVDLALMDGFYEIDLDNSDLAALPDASFDAIVAAHVIEHLHRGEEVLRRLTTKLAPGGILYVECPGPRSLTLPSMRGSLNFRDDPTHVRPFSSQELASILGGCGLRILGAGTRRDLQLMLLSPVLAMRAKLKLGYVPGGIFWDFAGFADFALGERPGETSPERPARVDPGLPPGSP